MTKCSTDRQERFAQAYIIDLNATKAAIAAGYSPKTANEQGSRLLANGKVSARIAELQEKVAKKYEVSAERVLKELTLLAYSNIDDYTDIVDGKRVLNTTKATRDQMAAVCEITEDTTGGSGDGERKAVLRTKFKMADKGINLERLGRHLKLFTDVTEHKGLEGLGERLAEMRKKKTEL